jgi:hypothetical protein
MRAVVAWTTTIFVVVFAALAVKACLDDATDPPPHFLRLDR